jgi:hypothetical protein
MMKIILRMNSSCFILLIDEILLNLFSMKEDFNDLHLSK